MGISPAVKAAVWERDGGICLWCRGSSGWPAFPEAHFIPRSRSGLGTEENILTLCRPCHMMFDQGPERELMEEFFREYLKSKYPGWDENNLVYKKGQF